MADDKVSPLIIIEEKGCQTSLDGLAKRCGQLNVYTILHKCPWGVLTDGEKWLVFKNFKEHLRIDGIAQFKRQIADIRECIGYEELTRRWNEFKYTDLPVVDYTTLRLIDSYTLDEHTDVTFLRAFLEEPSYVGVAVVSELSERFQALVRVDCGKGRRFGDCSTYVLHAYSAFHGSAAISVLNSYNRLVLSQHRVGESESLDLRLFVYRDAINLWLQRHPFYRDQYLAIRKSGVKDGYRAFAFCNGVDNYEPLMWLPERLKNEARRAYLDYAAEQGASALTINFILKTVFKKR